MKQEISNMNLVERYIKLPLGYIPMAIYLNHKLVIPETRLAVT